MITDYETFISHLRKTGRLKLLPRVLRELKEEAYAKQAISRRETSAENPTLVSGWRTIEDGVLTDHTGKRALLDIYKKIIS